ncbi:hypothetical protein [Streptomyces sp. NPDC048111]|uniref:hypothetical protein n=1 Tax=Streptomyces sp. NPDC048111 TaxID=3365500 RepID=UPI003723F174
MTGTTTIEAELGRFYAGRRLILIGHPLSAYARQSGVLRRMGAPEPFVVADGTGSGLVPEGIAGHHVVSLGRSGARGRALSRLLTAPPRDLRTTLDAYDRDRTALVVAETPGCPAEFDGRPVTDAGTRWGAAFADHRALDALWSRRGITVLPSAVVAPEPRLLEEAHLAQDLGYGTVARAVGNPLAPEANGPAHRLRAPRDAVAAARRLAAVCRVVRVMPHVPGTPCGIGGFVLPEGPVLLRPHEEIVLEARGALLSAGCSGHWVPGDPARRSLEDTALAVGAELRERHGYRGAFQLSGLLVGDGFLPWELGLRTGAGHALFEGGQPNLSTALLHAALVAGHDLRVSTAAFAALVDAGGSANAVISLDAPAPPEAGATRTLWLARDADGLHTVARGGRSNACLLHTTVGDTGRLLLVAGPEFAAARGQHGARLGQSVAQVCQLAAEHWEMDLPLETAW